MPRTRGILREKECHINETIAKAYKNYEDSIIQEIAKGSLQLPPYSEEEDETLMDEWTKAKNEKERKMICSKMWKDWHIRHNNEVIDWQPEDIKQLEYMLIDQEADGLSPTASGMEEESDDSFSIILEEESEEDWSLDLSEEAPPVKEEPDPLAPMVIEFYDQIL